MWLIIFGLVLITVIVSIFYLVSRFSKFSFVRKITGDNKKKKILIGLAFVAAIEVFTCIMWDLMNAMVCIMFLMLFFIICDVLGMLIRKVFTKGESEANKNADEKVSETNYRKYYEGVAAVIFTVVYLGIGWYLAHNVWRTEYVLATEKNVGDIRIVQFADSHVGTTFHYQGFEKQVKRMEAENPDVVLITGDFVDDETTKEDMEKCCEILGKMKTKYGVYYSFGNHDKGYYGDDHRGYSGEDLVNNLEKNGVTVLEDEVLLIDDRFYLVGRQDSSENDRGNSRAEISELTAELDYDKYIVVLDHQPNDYDNEAEAKTDLVLSGHTHGGQLIPITKVGEWFNINDSTYGLSKRDVTDFIVTSGISDWSIKFKTGCKSEYVVVDITGN